MLESVLVVPLLMLLFLVVVQFVVWAHAAQVVQLAASEGDRTARAIGGSPSQGIARAQSLLSHSSGVISSTVSVTVLPGDLARIAVHGRVNSILPGMAFPVSAVQIGPIQEFRANE